MSVVTVIGEHGRGIALYPERTLGRLTAYSASIKYQLVIIT